MHFVEPFHSFFTTIILVMVTCFEDNLLKKCSLGFEFGICKMGECLPTASPPHGWIMVKFCSTLIFILEYFYIVKWNFWGHFTRRSIPPLFCFCAVHRVLLLFVKNIYPDHVHGDILLPKNVSYYIIICPGGSDVHTDGDRAGHPGRGES